jgi:hypothetical protein
MKTVMMHGEFLRLVAEAGKRAAGAVFVGRAAVVVTELDEDDIAGLQVIQNAVPQSLGEEGPAAAAGAGTVDDIDPGDVEVIGEWVRPATVVHVAGGGIADYKDGGQLGIDGRRPLSQGGLASKHRRGG